MTILATPRLVLRPAAESDLEALHTLFSDAKVMRYGWRLPHTDLDETRASLAKMIAAPDDFVIEHDGVVIGKAGSSRPPGIGYMLLPSVWGRGYAVEALRAFLEHARASGYTHLTASVDPRNDASIRVLDRLGFHETGRATGTFTLGDELVDSVYYRLDLGA